MSDDDYVTVRSLRLAKVIGSRVVDITQHDEDEFQETGVAFIALHFDNGMMIKFPIGDDPVEVEG